VAQEAYRQHTAHPFHVLYSSRADFSMPGANPFETVAAPQLEAEGVVAPAAPTGIPAPAANPYTTMPAPALPKEPPATRQLAQSAPVQAFQQAVAPPPPASDEGEVPKAPEAPAVAPPTVVYQPSELAPAVAPPSSPVPDEEKAELSESTEEALKAETQVKEFFVLLFLFSVLMLVMIPIWNSVVLLKSLAYTQVLGAAIHVQFIVWTGIEVAGFLVVILAIFSWVRPEARTGQTFLMTGFVLLTLLGITFMLYGNNLWIRAESTMSEVMHNCHFGSHTKPMYEEAQQLMGIRMQPQCASLESVEQCPGFVETQESNALKALEYEFHCSRFCSTGEHVTLFSQANYASSCQMVFARHLRTFVADLGSQMYYEGIMLVLVCVAMFLLKLLGFCMPKSRYLAADLMQSLKGGRRKATGPPPPSTGYGSTEAAAERSRYVSRGVVL